MIEVLPTITCPPTYAELSERAQEFSFAPWVQLDIGDGAFVPARSWPYIDGTVHATGALPSSPALSYEAHLMVKEPRPIGSALAQAGARRILGHVEAFGNTHDAHAAFAEWKAAGAREVGLAALLDTPLQKLEPLLGDCDAVQLMSIAKLGYQGAAFEAAVYERIRALHAMRPELAIEIDGGVGEGNIAQLVGAGARRFGVGSAISKAADPRSAYEYLLQLATAALTAA